MEHTLERGCESSACPEGYKKCQNRSAEDREVQLFCTLVTQCQGEVQTIL